MNYQMAVAENEPFGVFYQRWDGAYIWFLTLALFAEASEIDMQEPSEYGHGPQKISWHY